MKRLLTVFLLALVASACQPAGSGHPVSKAEFDALVQQHQDLRASYDLLRSQLKTWADGVNAWAERTGDIVCLDINVKVTPNSAWSQEYQDHCTDGDPPRHPPDPPPAWG